MAEEGASMAAGSPWQRSGIQPTEEDGDSGWRGRLTAGAVSPSGGGRAAPAADAPHFEGTKRLQGRRPRRWVFRRWRVLRRWVSGGGGYYDGGYRWRAGGDYYGGDVYAPTAYYEPTPVYTYPQPVVVNPVPTYNYPVAPATTVVTPAVTYESP
jgi:hypothetical protein